MYISSNISYDTDLFYKLTSVKKTPLAFFSLSTRLFRYIILWLQKNTETKNKMFKKYFLYYNVPKITIIII